MFISGGPYSAFAGRDSTRGLATGQVAAADNDEYDPCNDLSADEIASAKEWEEQFKGTVLYLYLITIKTKLLC